MERAVDCLPDQVDDGDLVLRSYDLDDAAALVTAVTESLEHLRPWMPWIAEEPRSIAQRRERIAQWASDRRAGGDAVYGIWEREGATDPAGPGGAGAGAVAGTGAGWRLVGGTGLHRRIGPRGLEIGYWVHVDHTGRGLATRTAALLTTTAFTVPGVDRVEIHHDVANVASGRVAGRLGFRVVDEVQRAVAAPGECGRERHWRVERDAWHRARRPAAR